MSAPPDLQDTALDHLRVIRTLMERASLYRAVSAPAALVGGVLSLAVALWGTFAPASAFHGNAFLGAWLTVLFLTGGINILLLLGGARSEGQPLVSDGLRMALRALVPPMLTGGVLGICLIWFEGDLELAALVWILCYGLALQATVSFAPRSIIRLARAFLVTGQALAICYFAQGGARMFPRHEVPASILLGVTFGLFHIVYALSVFLGREKPGMAKPVGDGLTDHP